MNDAKLILIPGRTMKQGTGLNIGKESDEYERAVTTIEMNRDDMVRLGVDDGDSVRVRASGGEVTVQCRGADLPAGMAFIAYGPCFQRINGWRNSRIRHARFQGISSGGGTCRLMLKQERLSITWCALSADVCVTTYRSLSKPVKSRE